MIVIASLHTEASPIVLREAFASGRPLIATKVGDIPEIVQDRHNGLLIEPGDSRALAAAIMEFVYNPQLAAQCAANGLRYATEHFSFDKMMEAKLRADLAISRANAESSPAFAADAERRDSPRESV
jgi:glycosyltransferase involved in cell wall biosynthesis